MPVRQGDKSDEEETYSYMDELVMAIKDNTDIFGTEGVELVDEISASDKGTNNINQATEEKVIEVEDGPALDVGDEQIATNALSLIVCMSMSFKHTD